CRHQPGDRVDGVADRGRIMCGGYHKRWCQDPSAHKFLKHQSAECLTTLPQVVSCHISQVAIAAPQLEMRAQPGISHYFLDTTTQISTDPVESVCNVFALIDVDNGQHGG